MSDYLLVGSALGWGPTGFNCLVHKDEALLAEIATAVAVDKRVNEETNGPHALDKICIYVWGLIASVYLNAARAAQNGLIKGDVERMLSQAALAILLSPRYFWQSSFIDHVQHMDYYRDHMDEDPQRYEELYKMAEADYRVHGRDKPVYMLTATCGGTMPCVISPEPWCSEMGVYIPWDHNPAVAAEEGRFAIAPPAPLTSNISKVVSVLLDLCHAIGSCNPQDFGPSSLWNDAIMVPLRVSEKAKGSIFAYFETFTHGLRQSRPWTTIIVAARPEGAPLRVPAERDAARARRMRPIGNHDRSYAFWRGTRDELIGDRRDTYRTGSMNALKEAVGDWGKSGKPAQVIMRGGMAAFAQAALASRLQEESRYTPELGEMERTIAMAASKKALEGVQATAYNREGGVALEDWLKEVLSEYTSVKKVLAPPKPDWFEDPAEETAGSNPQAPAWNPSGNPNGNDDDDDDDPRTNPDVMWNDRYVPPHERGVIPKSAEGAPRYNQMAEMAASLEGAMASAAGTDQKGLIQVNNRTVYAREHAEAIALPALRQTAERVAVTGVAAELLTIAKFASRCQLADPYGLNLAARGMAHACVSLLGSPDWDKTHVVGEETPRIPNAGEVAVMICSQFLKRRVEPDEAMPLMMLIDVINKMTVGITANKSNFQMTLSSLLEDLGVKGPAAGHLRTLVNILEKAVGTSLLLQVSPTLGAPSGQVFLLRSPATGVPMGRVSYEALCAYIDDAGAGYQPDRFPAGSNDLADYQMLWYSHFTGGSTHGMPIELHNIAEFLDGRLAEFLRNRPN